MEEQGFDAEEESAEENLLQKFVDYVRVSYRMHNWIRQIQSKNEI